ncbi:restriction endonuclease subunit S [Oceanobacillus kimchii]|uniref:restriction endonuclease subunit S n=1 Tax=Oceanobacillus kimchii TaxID=746691 RepID=UPI000985870B|nr:restriction endonuclease subunit S [Oceanobacillus kimchii]
MNQNKFQRTKIGLLPNDWQVTPLNNYADIITKGTTPTTYGFNYEEEGINFVKIESIDNNGKFKVDLFTKISEEAHKKLKRSQLKNNDLLITIAGNLGRIALVNEEILPANTNQAVAIVRFSEKNPNDLRFIYHFLKGYSLKKYIQMVSTVGAQPNLSLKQVGEIDLALPPLNEQQKIAAILSSVDEAIEKTEQIMEQTETVKKGLMQQLLTKGIGQTDFKDTPIGKIPSSWNLISIDELFVVEGGMSFSRAQLSEDGYPYIHYGDIHASKKQYIDTEDFDSMPKINIEKSKIKQGAVVGKGDIVISDASEDTDGIGRYFVIRDQGNELIVSGLHTIVLKDKSTLLDDFYKEYVFQSLLMKKQFRRIATGATVYGISKGNVKKLLVPVPPKEEQIKIARMIIETDRKITHENSKLPFLRNIKHGLMQQLLTGKVRVSINENEEVPS